MLRIRKCIVPDDVDIRNENPCEQDDIECIVAHLDSAQNVINSLSSHM